MAYQIDFSEYTGVSLDKKQKTRIVYRVVVINERGQKFNSRWRDREDAAKRLARKYGRLSGYSVEIVSKEVAVT